MPSPKTHNFGLYNVEHSVSSLFSLYLTAQVNRIYFSIYICMWLFFFNVFDYAVPNSYHIHFPYFSVSETYLFCKS